jgi:transcriptional regulator with XRE-family HTH domain
MLSGWPIAWGIFVCLFRAPEVGMSTAGDSRQELAKFLRSRRERITPDEVGLPAGPRRRTVGLRREEVAVLAGLSPTWYTYLEQGRGIQPSREVLDSLARVLRLTEDERRYVHSLAHGSVVQTAPLTTDLTATDLIRQVVAQFDDSPYPVYAGDQYCELVAWNRAACEWYDDWSALPPGHRNFLHWLLSSPLARERLVDWEAVTQDTVARWRAECARHPDDPHIRARIAEFTRISRAFGDWWESHEVLEHRSAVRLFRHGHLGVQAMRIVVLQSPEFTPSGVVLHLPAGAE